MINTIKQNKIAVLAFLLALVMLFGLVPFTATEAHAMTIDATSGDVTWENGDSFTLVLVSKNDSTKTETHTVTYDGTSWNNPKSSILPAYAFAYTGEVNDIAYSNGNWSYTPVLQSDQSDPKKLANADVMIATGEVAKDAKLDLDFSHCYAKVTFKITRASEFEDSAEIKNLYVVTKDNDVPEVVAYNSATNEYSAYVTAGTYSGESNFVKIEIGEYTGDNKLVAKMPAEKTLEAGTHYTFDLKVGKDKVEITEVTTSGDWVSSNGWNTEENLDGSTETIGTADVGKTAWVSGDQVIASLTSQKYGTQTATATYNGTKWTLGSALNYLQEETPTLTAVYAPSTTAGLSEYIVATASIVEETADETTVKKLYIDFAGSSRNYSRLRIVGLPNQTLTVTTTGFTPAGASAAADGTTYTVTTNGDGNAYLYGTFAKDATVSVKKGTATLAEFTFSEDKGFSNDTEQGKSYVLDARPVIDLSQYADGATVNITEDSRIIGDGNEYNLSLNITEDATVIFEVGTSGVKLGGSINVADGKTLTLQVTGNAEHTVKGGISLGNSANVIIEGDLTQENNKLTVTSSGGNADIGANGGVTAGDITIRNARVDATGSTSDSSYYYMSGAGIGTANASMGNILIENSIVTAAGGYYFSSSSSDPTSHAAAIGMGSSCVTMGNITLIDSEITASNNGDGHASVIGAGSFYHPTATNDNIETVGNMGNIIITSTELNLSMAKGPNWFYAAMIGPGLGNTAYSCVNMGKIIFTDVTQAELDEMIATWSIPSDFNQYGAYVLGRGRDGSYYDTGDFGGVWVSDGNGGTVQIGDESGYYEPE